MHWSRGCSYNDHVADHAVITLLIMLIRWLSCTDFVADHSLITCLIVHWSCGWSLTNHVAYHALIRWLSCSDHVADHTLITWLRMHWSRHRSCTDHVAMMHWFESIISVGEYHADEQAGVARLRWRVSGRWAGRCRWAQLAIIRQLSRQVSRGSAGE